MDGVPGGVTGVKYALVTPLGDTAHGGRSALGVPNLAPRRQTQAYASSCRGRATHLAQVTHPIAERAHSVRLGSFNFPTRPHHHTDGGCGLLAKLPRPQQFTF